MKILILENEFAYIKTPFDYINAIHFGNSIQYDVHPNSQDIRPFSDIVNYDYVFVDISLGSHSELDGFGVLKKIENDSLVVKNLIILTGNHLIEENLKERGLKNQYKILAKPIDFKDLLSIIK